MQLEHVQTRLREIQPCLAESRAAREKESFNLKRAQVCGRQGVVSRFGLRALALSLPPLAPGGHLPAAAQAGEAEEGGSLCRR